MNAVKIAAGAVALFAAYLLLWPDGMAPVAWTPPPAPALDGPYAPNEVLKGIQKLAVGAGVGPEGVNVDAVGRVYAGYENGDIVQLSPDGTTYVRLANTGGRPLGITFGPNGGYVIADANKGLLHLGSRLTTLATEAGGTAFGHPNDADNTRLDKWVYFTDSSSKFRRSTKDILEHGANGRLLRYNARTNETQVLLSGLHFPNGVAVGPDDAYVLVSETAEYRVLRYWLSGEKAGTSEVFIDNLPGLPDNLSYNNRDRFWLALVAPRDPLLDALLPGDFLLRKVLARLGPLSEAFAARKAFVLGLDLDGHVVANLQYAGPDAYAPITSVREFGPWLYFGSRSYPAIGRLPLREADARAPQPPAGWDATITTREVERRKSREEEEEDEEERERRGKR